MSRVFSGIQPTGNLHLGNYLGALKNWVSFQKTHTCFFCIVDLHALTTPQDPELLRENTLEAAATYIAAGIDPTISVIFPQSSVPAHTELSWILGCMTPLGWLNRMTQFKEKAGASQDQSGLGLYAYPVLMAADILLYKATHVPVGDDQKQHLELARDIAGAFNRRFGQDYFPLPEPMILGAIPRVMSLRDGTQKMSKSDPSDYSRIGLLDSPDQIKLKIQKAKTDADLLPGEIKNLSGRPEARNLLSMYAALTDTSLERACLHFEGSVFSKLKSELTDVLVDTIFPINQRIHELLQDKTTLYATLKHGTEQALSLSQNHMHEIKKMMGLLDLFESR